MNVGEYGIELSMVVGVVILSVIAGAIAFGISYNVMRLRRVSRKIGFWIGTVFFVVMIILTIPLIQDPWGHRNLNVGKASIALGQLQSELFRYDDGREFNLASLPDFWRRHKKGSLRMYLEEKDVPDDLKAILLPSELPFVTKDKFRIISLGARNSKAVLFVRTDESKDDNVYTRELDYNLLEKK